MKRINELKTLLCVIAAAGFWSILYPELIFHDDVCRAVDESGAVLTEDMSEDKKISELFAADKQNIRLKSRLWEELKKRKTSHGD